MFDNKTIVVDEVEELAKKLCCLNVTANAYAGFHARMVLIALMVAQYYLPPFWTTATASHTPLLQHPYTPPQPHAHTHAYGHATSATYAPRQPWMTTPSTNFLPDDGTCHFCKLPGCNVKSCSTTREYRAAGHIMIAEGCYVFLDYTRIQRDLVCGYRGSIDDCYGGPLSAPQPATPRDIPLHMANIPAATPSTPSVPSFLFQCAPVVESQAVLIEEVKDEEAVSRKDMADEGMKHGEEESAVLAMMRGKAAKKGKVSGKELEGLTEGKHAEASGSTGTAKGDARGRAEEITSNSKRTDSAWYSLPRPSAFTYKSKAADPTAVTRVLDKMLDVVIPNITACDLLAISPKLRRDVVKHNKTHCIPTAAINPPTAAVSANTTVSVDYATPLRELEVLVNGVKFKKGLLDEGSEIVVIQKDFLEELGADVNRMLGIVMEMANGSSELVKGCVKMLEISIGNIKLWAHAYVVPHAPYKLLLGRPWQQHIRLGKVEHNNGEVAVTLWDQSDHTVQGTFQTTERVSQKSKGLFSLTVAAVEEMWRMERNILGSNTTHVISCNAPPTMTPLVPTELDEALLRTNYNWDLV